MEQKKYKVVDNETLENIAEKTGYTIEEIKEWHNSHSYSRIGKMFDTWQLPLEIILPPYPPKPKPVPTPEEREKKLLEDLAIEKETRYRCEQSVTSKINGIPINSAETKTEFLVKRIMQNGDFIVQILITDNIVTLSPVQYQEAINLVAELDIVKCKNLVVKLNPATGEMDRILNMANITTFWQEYKIKLQKNSAFVKNRKAAEAVRQFIDMAGKQITIEKNLLQDLQSKMFFYVYFSKYLIDTEDKYKPYRRTFYSQLFESVQFDLNIEQKIVRETKEETVVQKTSSIHTLNDKKIEEAYNQKFKPMIQYKFSEYRAGYSERCLYSEEEDDKCLKEAQVNITEEIKNNLQLLIYCNIKKIE